MLRSPWIRALLALAPIALGVALRLDLFLVNRALTLDEAALSRNLLERSWIGILRPLAFAQVAPPAFLLVQKGATVLFGASEYALRLFPLLCGIASVWLAWLVARRIVSYGAAIIATLLVAMGNLLVDYSVNVKQYPVDVAATLLIVLLTLTAIERTPTSARSIGYGLVGLAVAALSFTAVFALVAAALTCTLVAWQTPDAVSRRRLAVLIAWWMLAAAVAVLTERASMSAPDAEYMNWFWGAGFMPLPPADLHDLLWLPNRIRGIFSFTGQLRISIAWLALVAIGVWALIRRGRTAQASLLLLPLLLVIAAATVRLYPFESGRLELFLLPLLFVLVGEGVAWFWRSFSSRWRPAAAIPAVAVMALAAHSAWVGIEQRERDGGARTLMAYIRENWQPGDHIYVYYATGQQFFFYAPRYQFTPADYTVGTCSRGVGRPYLRELDKLRGHSRVWLVMSRYDVEPPVLLSYLDAIGTQKSFRFVKEPADPGYSQSPFVYLYDVRESKARSVSPELFPLPTELNGEKSYPRTCYGVFTPTSNIE
jgi:hypothetical protein